MAMQFPLLQERLRVASVQNCFHLQLINIGLKPKYSSLIDTVLVIHKNINILYTVYNKFKRVRYLLLLTSRSQEVGDCSDHVATPGASVAANQVVRRVRIELKEKHNSVQCNIPVLHMAFTFT